MMKKKSEHSQRYLAALRAYLGTRRAPGPGAASRLGRQLLAAGVDPLALARFHERAIQSLNPASAPQLAASRRAGKFFREVLRPFATAHRVTHAAHTAARLRQAVTLVASNRRLKREVLRRLASEANVRRSQEHYRLLFFESQVMQKKLRHLTHQIISAQEDERRKISRELHDEVVQTLVGINVHLAALSRAASIGIVAVKARIARTQRLVEKSVSAVHRFARELRPAVLDDLGLIPALHAYIKTVAAREKLQISLTAFAEVEALDGVRRTVLYRVAQEALTNVGRHAQARRVDMSIVELPGAIRMEVHDDGRSFPVLQTTSAPTNKRLGLVGMRERVEMVGGTLHLESTPGHGTTVRAEIPFQRHPTTASSR